LPALVFAISLAAAILFGFHGEPHWSDNDDRNLKLGTRRSKFMELGAFSISLAVKDLEASRRSPTFAICSAR
jgi:hypothetical protein